MEPVFSYIAWLAGMLAILGLGLLLIRQIRISAHQETEIFQLCQTLNWWLIFYRQYSNSFEKIINQENRRNLHQMYGQSLRIHKKFKEK